METDTSMEVVGVVRDTGTADRQGDLIDPTPQLFYRSFAQWDLPPTTVLARTSLDAAGLAGAMQRELRGINAALPVVSSQTMAQQLEGSLLAPRRWPRYSRRSVRSAWLSPASDCTRSSRSRCPSARAKSAFAWRSERGAGRWSGA